VVVAVAAGARLAFALAGGNGQRPRVRRTRWTFAPESIRVRGLTIRDERGHSAAPMNEAIAALTIHTDWLQHECLDAFGNNTRSAYGASNSAAPRYPGVLL
jgi:hypothetical protein